ncbi:D-alanine--D-alanine ligase [Planktosalinus lacus]|uniref:D-alanine--D-alanine ligase n=1 Tax=Planktosalinus lacus TaxID=1526573 RepID=A0A8J2Y9X2_9FLAO|nr:D-alanine--D-alanine ligase [Planktosalinus lacus]GGD88820.1 D-alanine--D-alanine ligase [Planktosalinus lacus]
MQKKIIAVAMGGYSSEYEISIQSGQLVYDSLSKTQYDVFRVYVTKDKWYYKAGDGSEFEVNKADFSFSDGNNTIHPDVIFNAIHGTPGEDGLLQAYFELIDIPHTSCNYYQAALTFNKRDCLSVLKSYGVHCANAYYLNKGDEIKPEEIIKKVGLPCFVKPSRSGSSFGISKVKTIEELPKAIEFAYKEDAEILIESCLVGTEVSVGVIEYKGEILVLPATEIVSENEFFDYEAKYLGKSQEITPARIPDTERERVKAEAKRIYELLNMTGLSRSEYIIQEGIPHFIEMNTNPGLSPESIIPKQALAAGISLEELFGNLVEQAFEKK